MKTNQKQKGIREEHGFSLVELMVVVGIILLGAMIGIPAYNTTIRPTADLNAAARRLYSDIQDARMMAVRDNTRYGLAFYSGPDRYIIFVDNVTANGQYDSGEQTIRTLTLANEYGSIIFDTGCAACSGDGITFANNAFALNTRALASPAGTIYMKNTKNEGRSVVVNTMGNVQIAEYTP